MKINGPSECFQFIRNSGLVNLCPTLTSFNTCMEEASRMCNCDPQTIRQAKVNQCKILYSNFVNLEAAGFKNELLSKISGNSLEFWVDNKCFYTLTR